MPLFAIEFHFLVKWDDGKESEIMFVMIEAKNLVTSEDKLLTWGRAEGQWHRSKEACVMSRYLQKVCD